MQARIQAVGLLNTAEQVILARGLSRTSLLDIAVAAGLSRSAIYWHFADKVALFNAFMGQLAPLAARQDDAIQN